MTTEERLEKLELEPAVMKHANRRLLAIVGLAIIGLGLAGIWTKTTAIGQGKDAGASTSGSPSSPPVSWLEKAIGSSCAMASLLMLGAGIRLVMRTTKGLSRRQSEKTSEEPWTPGPDFHIEVCKPEKKEEEAADSSSEE